MVCMSLVCNRRKSIQNANALGDLQEKVDAFSRRSIAYGDESQWPPLAVVSICRADKSSMRMSLRSSLVVGMLLNELKQLGWPPDPVDAVDKQTAPAGSQRYVSSHPVLCAVLLVQTPGCVYFSAGLGDHLYCSLCCFTIAVQL